MLRQQAGWTNFPLFVLCFNATLAQKNNSKFSAYGGVRVPMRNLVLFIIVLISVAAECGAVHMHGG